MELINGINFIVDTQKVFINNGVELYQASTEDNALQFDEDAYKPKRNWRLLTGTETNILCNHSKSTHFSRTIFLKKLPPQIITILKKLELHKYKGYYNVLGAIKDNAETIKLFQCEMKKILDGYSKNSEMEFHKITYNPPEIETLTFYKKDEKLNFVGLHIDRSTDFDFETVEKSKNRLCLNIGIEDRTLFAVNLTLNQMLKLISLHTSINNITIHNIGKTFFSLFPDYPIIKLVQSPYEYYIAPTDNFLHDGSTLGKVSIDICLTYLGYFNTTTNA